jgi:putative Holliday junction resolvase
VARILCIDYGRRRIGLAVTDPLQIIATPLTTIETKHFLSYLKDYISREQVEKFLIGVPLNLDNTDTHATPLVQAAIRQLEKNFPDIPVITVDERYTSKMASQAMITMGMKKKDRQKKENTDMIAAALMLQEYLASN